MKFKVICKCTTQFTIELDSNNYPNLTPDEDIMAEQMIQCELEFFQNNSDNYFEIASVGEDLEYNFEVVRA